MSASAHSSPPSTFQRTWLGKLAMPIPSEEAMVSEGEFGERGRERRWATGEDAEGNRRATLKLGRRSFRWLDG